MQGLTSSTWYWPGATIRALNQDGDILATIPLAFIQTGGANTWRFVADLLDLMVGIEPGNPPLLQTTSGGFLNLDEEPIGGEVIYWPGGAPQGIRTLEGDFCSGVSKKSNGTESSSSSYLRLLAKRGPNMTCFVTGYRGILCEAAHLVPHKRIDVYSRIWGQRGALVMLTPNIHSHYDSFRLSFYPVTVTRELEVWLIHYFCPPEGGNEFEDIERRLHGQRIIVSREDEHILQRPHHGLAIWHYTQAARLRFGPVQLDSLDDDSSS